MLREVLALEYKVIFWHSVHSFFLLRLVCMCTVYKVAYSMSVLWCVMKFWFETAFTKWVVEEIKEKGKALGLFPSVLAPSRSLGNGVLLPRLFELCGEESSLACFCGSGCVSSSLSIHKVWLFPQAAGCIFGCGQADQKWEGGRLLSYTQLSSWKSFRHHRYSALIRLKVGIWKWITASERSCNADCWQKNLTCWLFPSVTCISFKSPEVFYVILSWNSFPSFEYMQELGLKTSVSK